MGGVILHLGLGAFHRAHQAPFTQDANAAAETDWQIEAVSMRNPAPARALNAQGGRYGLILRHPEGPELTAVNVTTRAWSLPDDPAAVIARLAAPEVALVTLTVTEKGYGCTRAGVPNWDDPVNVQDLAHPDTPQGVLGLLLAGLRARRAAGLAGLTLISCDNLPANGAMLRAAVTAFAARRDPALADWIAQTCAFPSSMVDRITPAATPETAALALRLGGAPDALAIETEPFRDWVIEDHFAGPRPAWEAAGARLMPDVAPFEAMKLRLLNGAHTLIALLGALAGLAAVRDVVADPDLARAARVLMAQSAQTLPVGLDPGGYAQRLMQRFANPAIDHRCLQIATDTSQKLPPRILAPARELIAAGLPYEAHVLAIAAWMVFITRTDPLNDPLAPALRAALAASDPLSELARIDGMALLAVPGLQRAVTDARQRLEAQGAIATARALTGGG